MIARSTLTIRATRKLLLELRSTPVETPPVADPLMFHEWYANLLRIERRKCVLVTESRTLFTFLMPAFKRKDFDRFDVALLEAAKHALVTLGFGHSSIPQPTWIHTVEYRKTASRQVLGCMNDLAFMADHHIRVDGGLESFDQDDLTRRLNNNPLSPLEYNALDALQQALGEKRR